MSGELRLSLPQWDFVSEELNLGPVPVPLERPSFGRGDVERAALRREVLDQLADTGLGRPGQLDPDLVHALRVLQQPVVWVDGVWLPDAAATDPVRILAVRHAGGSVLARQDGVGLLLRRFPARELASTVVASLPKEQAGTGSELTIPLQDWMSPPKKSTVAERVAAIRDVPRHRAGQIAANVRESSGQPRRSPLLMWWDVAAGRYCSRVVRRSGLQWILVAPGDEERLTRELTRLVTRLTETMD